MMFSNISALLKRASRVKGKGRGSRVRVKSKGQEQGSRVRVKGKGHHFERFFSSFCPRHTSQRKHNCETAQFYILRKSPVTTLQI